MKFLRKREREVPTRPSSNSTWPPTSATFGAQLAELGHIGPALVNLSYGLPDSIRENFDWLSANIVDLIGDEATPFAAAFLQLLPSSDGHEEAVRAVNAHMSQVVSHGYKLGLVRLHLENDVLGRSPRHTWQAVDVETAKPLVKELADLAWSDAMRIQPWVSVGARDPFDEPLIMWAAIQYLALEDFKMIAKHYDAADPMPSLAIPGITAIGYAIARVQQEPDVMTAALIDVRGD